MFFVRAESVHGKDLDGVIRAAPLGKRLTGSDASAVAVGDVLVYSAIGALVAQRIDLDAQALRGQPMLLGTPVGRGPSISCSPRPTNDLLIHGAPASTLRELRWIDRADRRPGSSANRWTPGMFASRLARPRVAVTRVDPQLGTLDIWGYDGHRRPAPISPSIDIDETPVWSTRRPSPRVGHRPDAR